MDLHLAYDTHNNVIHRNAILAQHPSKIDIDVPGDGQLVCISQKGGISSRSEFLAVLPDLLYRSIDFVDAIDHRPGVIVSGIYAIRLSVALGLTIIEEQNVNGIWIAIRIR